MNKKIKLGLGCVFLFSFLQNPLFANDCLGYKINPDIELTAPSDTITITQVPIIGPQFPVWHGNVVATLTQKFDVTVDTIPVRDGHCIILKKINAVVGYSTFDIKIDSQYAQNSCTYNVILAHENEHVGIYLSVIRDERSAIKSAIFNAADSVMPIFAEKTSDMDTALDEINTLLQSHPDIILMKQKIQALQELRNKRMDQNSNDAALDRCVAHDL